MAQRTVERLSYFQFHVADYLLDTGDLTLSQHGAYCLLIFRYYWQGALEPSDIYRNCRTDADRADVDTVLARYFKFEDERYVHNRIERELASIADYIEHQSLAGQRSAAARAGKKKARINGEEVVIPQWLNAEQFKSWIKVRPSRARSPDAQRAAIAKLEKFKAEGFNPDEIVQTSLSNGWQGIFKPNVGRQGRHQASASGNFGRCKYCERQATRMTNDIPHCEEPRHLDWALSRQ